MSYHPQNKQDHSNHLEPAHYQQYGSETSSARSSIGYIEEQQFQDESYNPIPNQISSNDNTSIESTSLHEAQQYAVHSSNFTSSRKVSKISDNDKHYRTFSRAFSLLHLYQQFYTFI